MRPTSAVLLLFVSTLALAPADSVAQGLPTRSVTVGGTGVSAYPAFDPAVTRYGVHTTGDTAGSITVTATTSDPEGTIIVDGRPVASGVEVTVDGLAEGDEVAVRIDDDGGVTSYALVYLPVFFPNITVTRTGEGPAAGSLLLTLNRFFTPPYFEVALDENGVPVHVRSITSSSQSFQGQPGGTYSVGRPTTTAGRTGYEMVHLDAGFEEIRPFETTDPLVNTDYHDVVMAEDGSTLLMSYEADAHPDPVTDAVIQELAPDGSVAFEWDSEDHIPEEDGLLGAGDYAHVNSLAYTADGDILASFRNTSQVLLIARTAHDGFDAGDVIWRLGGVHSDFAFVDDPEGGFCAQHTARLLPDGHLLVWDNGAQAAANVQTGDVCPNPSGGRHGRPFSRAAEYELDLDAMTATLVWSYDRDGRYTQFAGSAQRLADGHTLVGWVEGTPIATEVDTDGEVVWELSVDGGFTSYRSLRVSTPDAIDPTATLTSPADGATFGRDQAVTADFGCTDRGGSTLQTCEGATASGGEVDTSTPGTHEFAVTATDGAGNTSTVTHTYEVAAGAHQPDAVIRRRARGPWVGNRRYNADGTGQTVVLSGRRGRALTALVRVQDDGTEPDALTLRGARNTAAFQVRYLRGNQDITAALKAGTFTTPELAPGGYFSLRVEIIVKRAATIGAEQHIRVTGTSDADPGRTDTVVAVARATA